MANFRSVHSRLYPLLPASLLLMVGGTAGWAQSQGVGLTLGGLAGQDRVALNGTNFNLGPGLALEADYEYRVIDGDVFSLYAGVHFLANAQRKVASANPAPRQLARGVFTYGGGIDVPVWRFVALRGEVRDFYSGSPAFNALVSGGQHNLVAGAGIVLRFGGK